MSDLRNKIFKLRLKLLYLTNNIRYYFTDGVTVNVVSSKKYQNKIKDDLVLQKYLLKEGYRSKVVAWEDNEKADVNVIRSVWGYHNNLQSFITFINENNTINNKSLILENISKRKQFELLGANDVEKIDTLFVDNIMNYHYRGNRIVVKPVISASGENTFYIDKAEDLSKVAHLNNIMIQPFLPGIGEGEISVITINRNIRYAIKRFPGVFTEYKKPEYISKFDINKDIVENVRKLILIEEYKKAVIMRIDFVKDNDERYKVMEVEMVDPDLFIETIPDKKIKQEVYEELTHSVNKFLSVVDTEE